MTPRRIAFWLLAVAGVAVGHVVGYTVAHPDAAAREAALGGHAYLPGVASAVIPAGVVALLWWSVRTARALGLAGRIEPRRLAVAQVAVFAAQEVGERLVNGEGAAAAVSERGVWFGLVAQVVVAYLSVRALDLVRRIVRAARPGRRHTGVVLRASLVLAPRSVPSIRVATVAVGLRAPPVLGSTH